jgi:dipeptidyl-peptidase-3
MMTQLVRLNVGDHIEEAHMRNRAWISHWVFEKGQDEKVIEKVVKDGKTYFVVRDYDKLRVLFGELLKEVQRIKSQGDFKAAQNLVENYGVVPNKEIHAEVKKRYESLGIAPYSGFIQPRSEAIMKDGKIVDVKLHFDESFEQQMLRYGKDYNLLPIKN